MSKLVDVMSDSIVGAMHPAYSLYYQFFFCVKICGAQGHCIFVVHLMLPAVLPWAWKAKLFGVDTEIVNCLRSGGAR